MLRRITLAALLLPFVLVPLAIAAQTESSIDNPLPMGTTGTIGDYTVTVTGYIPDASAEIVARQEGNTPPEDGYVYALITLEVGYNGSDVGKASSLQLQYVGSRRSALTDVSCTSADRTLANGTIDSAARDADIFSGGSVEFEQCVYLPAAEAEKVILYVLGEGNERVFFQLVATGPGATPAASPEAG